MIAVDEHASLMSLQNYRMAQFNETLMLLAMEPTRYLSVRDCVNLERVSHSASDVVWLCYPVVTDLSAFGITDQMTHNAFSDLPRHCTAFFRRFDCNRLTSLRVPWNPQTIVIKNGISCSDAGMLLEKCPNLVELPPIDVNFENSIELDNMLSGARKRLLQSITLYSDLSHYEQNTLLHFFHSFKSGSRVCSTSVGRSEIALKIPFNIDFAINTALGAFIRFIGLRFDISTVKSLKVFVASNFVPEDRRDADCPHERKTSVNLPSMFKGWTSLEEFSITIEHSTTRIFLVGGSDTDETNLEVFPSLRTFSIVPLHSASEPMPEDLSLVSEFGILDEGTLACMPVLRHLNIGSLSTYWLRDVHVDSLSVKSRKEIFERTVLILNENKIQKVWVIGPISKEVATPEVLARIGQSAYLRHFTLNEISISTDTLLNILKRNKHLEFVAVINCDGIGDELFTLLAQAQLRKVSRIGIPSCSPAGIKRYMKWRMRQIEHGHDLAQVTLRIRSASDQVVVERVAALFPNIDRAEILKKAKINFL